MTLKTKHLDKLASTEFDTGEGGQDLNPQSMIERFSEVSSERVLDAKVMCHILAEEEACMVHFKFNIYNMNLHRLLLCLTNVTSPYKSIGAKTTNTSVIEERMDY